MQVEKSLLSNLLQSMWPAAPHWSVKSFAGVKIAENDYEALDKKELRHQCLSDCNCKRFRVNK
jgi:hypothetical protein